MSKTKADCMNLFLKLIDESTKKGVELPLTKNADYRDKFNYFLDYACTYIAGIIKIPAVFTVTQNPIPNLMGLLKGFDIWQYRPDLPTLEKTITVTGAKSYYLELDNIATVTIAVNGTITTTINNVLTGGFTAYKGNIAASSTDTVTVTFGGLYPYNRRNTALYAYIFPTDADVPVYMPYTIHDMPTDFMSFDSVIIKSDPRIYDAYTAYKWESNKKVILNYYDKGSFDIHYFRYPTTILPDAADSTVIDADDNAIELIVMQAGIKATAADNPSLSSWLRQLYVEQMQNVANDPKIGETSVQTIYSMG